MRRLWVICAALACIGSVVFFVNNDMSAQTEEQTETHKLTVDDAVTIPVTHRIGINLGTWTTWGAEQLPCNIIMNPGFEGKRDRITVIVAAVQGNSFFDERGLNHPDGYWNGATYDIRTGPDAGKRGVIKQSLSSGPGDLPQYTVEGAMPAIKNKDVIVLEQTHQELDPIAIWWVPKAAGNSIQVDPKEHRPGSPGKQSLRLQPRNGVLAEAQFYWDGIYERAGKLLVIKGPWRFSVWAKASDEKTSLDIAFQRLNGKPPLFRQVIRPSREWKEYTFEFEGHDDGPPQFLKLSLTALGEGGQVWIDDTSLCQVQPDNNTPFRKEVVDALKAIKPYCIRDHQGQLGDSFANRVAPIFARGAFRYRISGGGPQWWFGYSNGDLFDLCEEVGAYPWVIMPTGYSDEELVAFGEYLAENANKERFAEMYLEFGNENWNWIFRATGIPYPEACGAVADRAFRLIRQGAAGKVNLIAVVNGQYAVPTVAEDFARFSKEADQIAVSPYFTYSLSANKTDAENLQKLFEDDEHLMQEIAATAKKLDKQVSVYEVNLHTTQGDAKAMERDAIAAGAASGTGMMRRLLQSVLNGAHPQNVFALVGFDAGVANVDEWVRLWGVYRDVSPTNRARPTGLATILLNKVIGGSLHKIHGPKELTMAAFRTEKNWKAAFASQSPAPTTVELTFPDDGRELPGGMLYIDAISPFDTNEDRENVHISESDITVEGRTVTFIIPAWGVAVLPAAIDLPAADTLE